MALMKCPECKKKISDQCINCPKCGYSIQNHIPQHSDNDSGEVSHPEVSGKKPFYKKAWLWVVVGVALVAIIIGAIYLLNRDTKPKLDKSGNPIFVELTNEVYTNAKKYKGCYVNIKGQVFQVMGDNGTVKGIQIWLDPDSCEQNVMIYYNTDAEVKKGDYIICTGYISSVSEYKNAYGATMHAPSVISTDLKQATYIEVMAPTTDTFTPSGLKQEKYGYSLSVNKIEFSEKETRVYVTATNNGNNVFRIYSSSAVIVQSSKQYESTTNYEANYEELPYEIAKGASCSGIIVFPAMSTNDFELTINVQSDDYDEKLEKYAFLIGKAGSSTIDIERQKAIVDGEKYKNEHKNVVLSTYALYEHLTSLGYSETICEDLCFTENVFRVYDGAAVAYEYERVEALNELGNSREAIINYYYEAAWPYGDEGVWLGITYDDAIFFVDACLAGKKLHIDFSVGYANFIEVN